VYILIKNSGNVEVEEVYDNIDKVIENVKEMENLISMGDWNFVVGGAKANNLTGVYGLRMWNNRGDRLIELCSKYYLIVANTCFNHD